MEEGGRLGVAGLFAGAALGGIGGISASSGMYINNNQRFISESPYIGKRRLSREGLTYGGSLYRSGAKNTSLDTAADLNADGNIVLGMHNLRRGG